MMRTSVRVGSLPERRTLGSLALEDTSYLRTVLACVSSIPHKISSLLCHMSPSHALPLYQPIAVGPAK